MVGTTRPSRRPLAAAMVGIMILVGACGGIGASPAPADQTGELLVLDWAGYDDPLYWQDFKDKYPKVDVGFEIGGSDGDIYGKMAAGDQADVFHPYTGWIQFYADEGIAAEIDTSKLTNWDKVPEAFKKMGEFNGKQYCVPYDWGFSSILYNTEKVTEPIDSWAALLDPAHDDQISMWDDGPAAVTVSSYIHGYDETAITDDQLADIQAEWTEQAKLNKAYWVGEPDLVQMFQNGDASVAYAWQGAYATLLGEGVPVAYADPKEGRNSWVGVYCIRKDTPNMDLALAFVDQKLGEVNGNNLVNNFYYGHANQDVMNGITDETLRQAFSLDDPSVLEKTNFTPNLTAEQRDAWTAMWNEVKASQ